MRISPQSLEIERVYTHTIQSGATAIAVTGINPGDGTTSLAVALAERSLLAGHSTLLVDFNLHRPGLTRLLKQNLINSGDSLIGEAQLVEGPHGNIGLLGIPAPIDRDLIIKLREPGTIESCIANLKEHFEMVIFDTSPINRVNASNIPSERVAAACDGVVLSILANETTESMVLATVEKLEAANVRLLGSVLNDCLCPSLKDELVREAQRLQQRFPKIANRLAAWVDENRLLSLEL